MASAARCSRRCQALVRTTTILPSFKSNTGLHPSAPFLPSSRFCHDGFDLPPAPPVTAATLRTLHEDMGVMTPGCAQPHTCLRDPNEARGCICAGCVWDSDWHADARQLPSPLRSLPLDSAHAASWWQVRVCACIYCMHMFMHMSPQRSGANLPGATLKNGPAHDGSRVRCVLLSRGGSPPSSGGAECGCTRQVLRVSLETYFKTADGQ